MIEYLIKHGAAIGAQDKYGMRPISWAAWFGHLDVLKVLINFGALPTVVNKVS